MLERPEGMQVERSTEGKAKKGAQRYPREKADARRQALPSLPDT